MRVAIILVCVVLVMVFLGWLTFGNTSGQASINIETQKIQNDTQQAVDKTGKVLQEVGKEGKEFLKKPAG